ncbi:MAG: DUF1330 domain-containing protein [Chloroflexi bacterium]|nr:DUF1330 domain-containing protein [Chloroflexota bacterium]
MAIYPNPEQIKKLMEGPADTPVVMINLLRFKQRADDIDRADAAESGASGQEAYAKYGEQMRKFVESKGGRFIWAGRIDSQVIGEGGEGFHMAALVEYPSRKAFLEIIGDPHVQDIGEHRQAGLEMQWLLASTGAPLGEPPS